MNAFHWRGPATTSQPERKRGRPRLDIDDEERKQRHREAALQSYHKSGKTTRELRYPPRYFTEQGDKDRGRLA